METTKPTSTHEFKTFTFEDCDYQTLLTKKFENRKPWVKANPKEVISYLPGTIQKVMVVVGQEVKAGEPIMLLESMKMHNIIRSAIDGKIKAINIKEGETIPKGFLMIEFV